MIKYTGTVLNYDGIPDLSGDIFDENTAISLPSENVPVYFLYSDEFESLCGFAKLYFAGSCLRYSMEILRDEKFPKQILDTLTPCITGVIKQRSGSVIKDSFIYSILLADYNTDKRIKPLGEQE